MKSARWLVALLAMALIVGLVAVVAIGCGEETAGDTTGDETATEETVAPETTVSTVADTGQTWELKMSYSFPQQASLYRAMVAPWCAAVEEATDGRVTIEQYPAGTLAKDDQMYDALLSGTCDIAIIEPGYTAGVFPVLEVGAMPRLFTDPAMVTAAMLGLVEEYGDDELSDVEVLGITCISGAQFHGDIEVNVPSDLDGVKMRSGGKVENWILQELGSEPIDILAGDLATSIERGLADGAFLSWEYVFAIGVQSYTPNRTHLDLIYRPWPIMMNQDVWNTMPTNIQDAIMSVSTLDDWVTYTVVNEEITQGAKQGLIGFDKGNGNPGIYEPTEDEMQLWHDALLPVWDKWIAELADSSSPYASNGQEILDFLEGKVVEYSTTYADHLAGAQVILDAIAAAEAEAAE